MDRTSLRLEQSHVKFIKSSNFFPFFSFLLFMWVYASVHDQMWERSAFSFEKHEEGCPQQALLCKMYVTSRFWWSSFSLFQNGWKARMLGKWHLTVYFHVSGKGENPRMQSFSHFTHNSQKLFKYLKQSNYQLIYYHFRSKMNKIQ